MGFLWVINNSGQINRYNRGNTKSSMLIWQHTVQKSTADVLAFIPVFQLALFSLLNTNG